MEFETLVQSRRSVRGFRNEPVPRSVIEAIIESAKREVARIPEDEVIMTCVAMGYPDETFAANAVRSDREHNDEFVRFVGFAD
ncbi:nitroreductase [Bradyrhizobium sp. LM2.7]